MNPNQIILKYTGQGLQTPIKDLDDKNREIHLAPYILEGANNRLVESVRLAIALRRPLLLKGEPGCGKTKLAEAVAYEIYGKNYKDHYFEWHIKSTSKATDGLYTFDHIQRLRDAQLEKTKAEYFKSDNPEHYIHYGELGKAFLASKKGTPSILLIDEVDKADIDFPNDLLLELDQKRFTIPENNDREVIAEEAPIIFITSNNEKELPQAFLRRCIFHYIEFPTIPADQDIQASALYKIIHANFPNLNSQLKEIAIQQFYTLRNRMESNNSATQKKVSTSELIDWVRAMELTATNPEDLNINPILFNQVLLKSLDDYSAYALK